eukprot:Gb_18645 [translate_table: standard]
MKIAEASVNEENAQVQKVALVAGVTGLVGTALADILVKAEWKVYGVARAPQRQWFGGGVAGSVEFIGCDLIDRNQTLAKISPLWDVTHVFWVTWAAHFTDDSLQSYQENRRMFCNALDALLPNAKGLKHICLQTGTKHYHAFGFPPPGLHELPLGEDTPRLPNAYNFYYALEDVLLETVKKKETLTWSVHRPGLIFGQSARSFFNLIGSLAVYATICKALDLPFVFHGSRACWEETYMDASDAELVAEQEVWAAMDSRGQNQAFNTVNGDGFTWKQLWPVLATKFGLEVVLCNDESKSLVEIMSDKGAVWDEIVQKHSLRSTKIQDLADWWFLDSLFRFPFKMLASTKRCKEHGFHKTKDTQTSLVYWIDRMRERRLIP